MKIMLDKDWCRGKEAIHKARLSCPSGRFPCRVSGISHFLSALVAIKRHLSKKTFY
ncbi:hypothetical protein [Yersinia alsatica]|uniref:hypothetical protein n=1 Tax=Yersinia alsatica TaxID=2890317 RepID=UPI001C94DAE9|nr:hypothetical protein [Yersinia alsatica]